MSPACIRRLLWPAFILVPVISYSQLPSSDDGQFLKHLRNQKLYAERLFFLEQLPDQPQFTLEKAWTFQILGRYDSAINNYDRLVIDTVFSHGFGRNYLSVLFKYNYGEKMNQMEKILARFHSDTTLNNYRISVALMNLEYPVDKLESINVPDPLYAAYKRYHAINKKSGLLALGFSMIIPGAGKVYYGQFGAGLNMFIANAALGLQAYESYRKSGVNSARFVIFGGLFSIFYLSNIYGTYKGLKKIKRDRRLQLNYEISDHYHNTDYYPGRY
ncbi:MAG: hypothetical protein WDO14_19200 [Bacteroidota bacterium]